MSWKFLKIAPGCCHVSTESSGFIGLECTEYWELSLDVDNYFSIQKTEVMLAAWSAAAMKGSITSSRTARGTDRTDVKSWDGAALTDSQHLSFKEAAAQPSHVRRFSRQAEPSLLSPGAMGRACRSPGESSGLAALFPASPKDTRPTEAAPRSSSDESSYSSSNAC